MYVQMGKKTEAEEPSLIFPQAISNLLSKENWGEVGGDDATGLTASQDRQNKEHGNGQHEKYGMLKKNA